MAGIYLHIPFCKQACYYCDFHFSTQKDLRQEMVDALCAEMALQKNYLDGENIETIYFGGGTPSLLSANQINTLLESLQRNFSVNAGEITLEANPDDLSESTLYSLKAAGINRLSIGIQSFDDRILKFLHRAHTTQDAEACIERARKVGFTNLSIDLIYSIPGQEDELWKKNIERAIALQPEHISAYALTIEEKTVFGNWRKKGKLTPQHDDVAASQMELLINSLSNAGYEHYEISNFSKPGYHARHNSSYWQQKKYLGIGPSAHSYNGYSRQYNLANNPLYIQSIAKGIVPFEVELLTAANKINEYLLTSLRTKWGCDLEYLSTTLSYDLLQRQKENIEKLLHKGLLEKKGNVLLLTHQGKMLADQITSELFVED
ncbi:MAG: radical SAM family heme chaperone HemW [Bacteroidetes bacterium]|nr:radical SAM family heme chaperone HemW [Bacteroidota bacterium]